MNPKMDFVTSEEINSDAMERPHVVILGAGASLAACPNGDRNGKQLPLMADFAAKVNLRSILEEWGIDYQQNFEEIFNNLYERGEIEKIKKIELKIKNI